MFPSKYLSKVNYSVCINIRRLLLLFSKVKLNPQFRRLIFMMLFISAKEK